MSISNLITPTHCKFLQTVKATTTTQINVLHSCDKNIKQMSTLTFTQVHKQLWSLALKC